MGKVLAVTYPISVEDLTELARREKDGRVRTRLLAVRLVALGHPATQAAKDLGLGESQTCVWINRFNEKGPGGLRNFPKKPRRSRLKPEYVDAFSVRVRSGAQTGDEVTTLRGKDFRRILKNEFGAEVSLSGTYYLLHKLKFSNRVPRPQHPASDPVAQASFKKTACFA